MTESELVARLENLERDNQRLKRIGAAVLIVAAALGLIAATRPVPDVIKAHRFEAVDAAGKTKIRVDADMAGAPVVVLYDKKNLPQGACPASS